MKPLIALMILAAALLRFPGLFDDFWLDEIWSLRTARSMNSMADVLRGREARFDNNHPLNTLLMYLIGDEQDWWTYRIPALLAGIGSVALGVRIMRRRGRAEAIVAALLLGASYPLSFYSSEARGYSLAVFFALWAIDALDRIKGARPFIHEGWEFWLACALGFFSHLTFLFAYLGMFAWSIHRLAASPRRNSALLKRLAILHAIPISFLGWFWWIFIRHIEVGGSPPQQVMLVLFESIGRLFASGESHAAAIVATSVAAALLIASIFTLQRHNPEWSILVMITLLSAAIVLGCQLIFVTHHQPIAPRYFLVPYSILLLGICLPLARWLRDGKFARAFAAGFLIIFVAANLRQTSLFLRIGRGHYSDAVAFMAEQTPSRTIAVLSDDPTRTSMVLRFYASRMLPPDSQMIIYDDFTESHPRSIPPLWIVLHNSQHHAPPQMPFGEYYFDRDFDYYGLSGYCWYLYRRR